jgi:hypothetical protein
MISTLPFARSLFDLTDTSDQMKKKKEYSLEEVIEMVRKASELAGGGSALAAQWKVTPALITMILHGNVNPGPRVLKHLGLRSKVTYTYIPVEDDEAKSK